MDIKATILEPLNRLQKLTEAALEQHGKLSLFSKAMQEQIIDMDPSHAIRFAYCCDCFRMATDTVFSDGVLLAEEAEALLPFVRVLAKLLNPIISSFEGFETASVQDCQRIFALYKAETGAFGYANEQTKWAGAELAQKYASVTGNEDVANIYKQMIDKERRLSRQ